jgi:hypothetical protein
MRFADANINNLESKTQGLVFSNATKTSILSSSLNLRPKSCSDMELGSARAVISEEKGGNNILNRQKTNKIVTTPLTPAIAGSNVAEIFLTTDVDSYNVAEDATQ